MKILITGYKTWTVVHEKNEKFSTDWCAYLRDPEMPDTGAPVIKALILDDLVDKIELYESGLKAGENVKPR